MARRNVGVIREITRGPKLIRVLKNLYEGIMVCVRIEGENTEVFDVKTSTSPRLHFVPNTVQHHTWLHNETSHGGQTRNSSRWKKSKGHRICWRCSFTSRDFDGSSCIIALTNYMYLANESETFGWKLNFPKTKIMAVTRKFEPLKQAVVNNNNIEVVEMFNILVVS